MRTEKILIRLGWSESSLGAQVILFLLCCYSDCTAWCVTCVMTVVISHGYVAHQFCKAVYAHQIRLKSFHHPCIMFVNVFQVAFPNIFPVKPYWRFIIYINSFFLHSLSELRTWSFSIGSSFWNGFSFFLNKKSLKRNVSFRCRNLANASNLT